MKTTCWTQSPPAVTRMRLSRGLVVLVISTVFGFRSCPENCKGVPNSDSSICDSHTRTCFLGCKPGYYGNTCNKMCDVNCQNKMCQQRDGSCMCSSGYTFTDDYCKPTKGVKCRSNDHCLHDTCLSASRTDCLEGCKPGWYGQFCQQPCSAHCSCDRESGNCTRCRPGWYGRECEFLCSQGCLNKNCDRYRTCIDRCTTGLYRRTCYLNCPAQCVSGCDQLSGECFQCEAGRYGSTCECSVGCAGTNKDCDRDGICIRGCRIGYFGETCESTCPEQCDGGLCNMTTGVCTKGCKSGYFGSFCNLTCANCQGGDCDASECTGTDFQRTWIPFIMGGGMLLIFGVLAVFMTFCLKRIDSVFNFDVKWRRRPPSAVQDVGPVAAPGNVELNEEITITPPSMDPIRQTSYIHPRHGGCSANNPRIRSQVAGVSVHKEGELGTEASPGNILFSNRQQEILGGSDEWLGRPDSYLLPNYSELNEDLMTTLPHSNEGTEAPGLAVSNFPFTAVADVHKQQHHQCGNANKGEISIPLIAECFRHIETEDSPTDENYRPENYNHPFKDYV